MTPDTRLVPVEAIQRLILAADSYGVRYLDSDDMTPEAEELQAATEAMKDILAAPALPAAEPVAWRPVVGFEGHYEVSAFGDIRNAKTGKLQAKCIMGKGYIKADLWKDGRRTQTSVHRVVAEAFLPRRVGLNEVNHIDGDKANNAAWNLEWTNRKGNTDHSRYVLGNDVKSVLATDPETGAEDYFPSIEAAGRAGYNASGIYDALKGRKRTHGGRVWSFTEWRGPASPHPAPDASALREEDKSWLLRHLKGLKEAGHCGEGLLESKQRGSWNDRIERILAALSQGEA